MSAIAWDKPNPARMYDFFLGGYHNFDVDRKAAERVTALNPDAPAIMRANRAFLGRATRYLLQERIEQFLDIGAGIPTAGSVHEIVWQTNSAARIVYVDSDPVAVRHSQAILADAPYVAAIEADARKPEYILGHPEVVRLLDFGRPVACTLVALLHFIVDDTEAFHLIHSLRDALPSGSFIVISHGTADAMPSAMAKEVEHLYGQTTTPTRWRSRIEIERFFEGLTLIEPGLVHIPLWRPASGDDLLLDQPSRSAVLGAVARKA